MFFDFLKRNSQAAAPAKKPSRPKRSPSDAPSTTGPVDMSALQVTEAADSTTWKLWKDSVAMIESQLSAVQPAGKDRRRAESDTPTQHEEITPYARVRKP